MFCEITIIIPCYNRQDFLPRLLRSLNDQEMDKDNFRAIIVDDGSHDPVSIDSEMYDFKIDIYRHNKNLGLPSALNTALKNTNTRFFVRIDSDDYVHKSFLKVLKLKFEVEPNVKVVALDYIKVDQTEKVIGIFSCDEHPIGCGIMFRTEIIKVIGMYNEKMLLAEEIDFRNRVMERFKIHRIELPLYRYVQHDNNITNNKELYDYYKDRIDE